MEYCPQCNRHFISLAAFRAHCRDRADHFYCESCDKFFVDGHDLQQHLYYSAAHSYSYDAYDKGYENDSYRYYSALSNYVASNTAAYNSQQSFYQPVASNSGNDYWSHSQQSLVQHVARRNYCSICLRDFATPMALSLHNASHVHDARSVKCIFCSGSFKTPSALALHVEGGGCGKGITRHHVTAAAQWMAPTVSASRRITGPAQNIVQYSASERAWNGTAYECYLCHRTFRTLISLNAHLDSAAHDADAFKCPKCKRTYKLISGLIQHIESEVCGLAKFQQVMDGTSELTDQFRRLLTL